MFSYHATSDRHALQVVYRYCTSCAHFKNVDPLKGKRSARGDDLKLNAHLFILLTNFYHTRAS
jgi:hypothetical protein